MNAHERITAGTEVERAETAETRIAAAFASAGVRRDLYELTVDPGGTSATLIRTVDGATARLVDDSDPETRDYWLVLDLDRDEFRHDEGALDMVAEWAGDWLLDGKPFTGVVVNQSPDQAALEDIAPLHPVGVLTDDERDAFRAAVDAAMRPLVTAAWIDRGAAVRWTPEPRLGAAGILYSPALGDLDGDVAEQLTERLASAEVAVWGEAYEQLDVAKVWRKVRPHRWRPGQAHLEAGARHTENVPAVAGVNAHTVTLAPVKCGGEKPVTLTTRDPGYALLCADCRAVLDQEG